MVTLRALVERELSKREEGDGKWPVLTFIVCDDDRSMTNVEQAAKAVIAEADARGAGGGHKVVRVTFAIANAVVGALRAAYPKRYILTKPIVGSSRRHEIAPDLMESDVPSPGAAAGQTGRADGDEVQRHNDEVQRAADRLRQLRKELGQF
jgi:hypothetical protein